ncbi:MAG: 3-hydroxyacyl-CoA dehydrogenase family protein, partial [Calditrichaeota bacterium]|nr:3-hydroxyacyl-CoA dehydrogenase family protein [Calditrichota bacterium]
MANTIQQVAVLGSGLMGGQIAALFASIDIPVLLYDVDQETADENFRKITRLKPPALFDPAQAKFVTTCNYEEDLEIIADADWVIEAVVERQAVKQDLYRRIEPFLKPEAILSTNTYGLSREALSGEMSPELAERFLITHFYNPPRYSHLLEIVPGPETRPGVVETIAQFCDHKLGKGIVFAKDTPNFIAHRIGIFFYMMSLHVARSLQLSVETIDQVSGIITGYNQQALCRMADRVGVDTLALAARTCYEHCPD